MPGRAWLLLGCLVAVPAGATPPALAWLTGVEPEEPAGPVDPLGDLVAALARGTSPGASLASFLERAPEGDVEARGRLAVAEQAYRAGDPATVRSALTPALLARRDYPGAYACYLAALLAREAGDPGAYPLFVAAFERAGATLLRLRAGQWIAEELRASGDADASLRMLEALETLAVEETQRTDLAVRRAALLQATGRAADAASLLGRIYLEQPLLGYRAETKPLWSLVRAGLEGRLDGLPLGSRLDRVEALLEARVWRDALREARALVRGARGADAERLHLLQAKALAGARDPRGALREVDRIPRSSRFRAEARLVRARALRALGRRKDELAELRALASDASAGPTRYRAAHELARRLADDEPGKAAEMWAIVAGGPPGEDADEAAWQVAWQAFTAGETERAARRLGALLAGTRDAWAATRARYWAARSLERLGRKAEADLLFAEIVADEPGSYYGMAAAHRTAGAAAVDTAGAKPIRHLLVTAPAPAAPPGDPLLDLPPGLRAELVPAAELIRLGLHDDALAELGYQVRRLPGEPAPRLLLARLHDERGDYMKSVSWLKQAFPDAVRRGLPARYRPYLYPLPYRDAIETAASAEGIDPLFAAAVIYQESRFQRDARSSAGAVGLMQLLPSTARDIARKLRAPEATASRLRDPDYNIRFGLHYLTRLLEEHSGNAVLALAGYNAGPGRARRWARQGPGDLDELVETIPFRETRNYVKNIIVAHQAYRVAYGGEPAAAQLR